VQTFSELARTVLEQAFPEDIAPNLQTVYKKRLLDGLINIQRYVPQLQKRQYALYPFASTFYRQGMTVINKPAGRVRRLGAFCSRKLDDLVYYDACVREDIDRLTQQRARYQTYPDAVQEAFPVFAASTETDKDWRAERGLFCIDDKSILVVPHIESNERLMVEWQGLKDEYEDTDAVDFAEYQSRALDVLVLYLQKEAALRDTRSTSDYVALTQRYREALADLKIDAKEDSEVEPTMEDIGILPRTILPTNTSYSLGCNMTDGPYFNRLWLYCADNGLWYNFGALVIDGQVLPMNEGEGAAGGKPEATVETLRLPYFYSKANDDRYYKIGMQADPLQPTTSPEAGEGEESRCKSACNDFAALNLELLGDDGNYYRINLRELDGVVVAQADAAPTDCPVVEEDAVLEMRDTITGKTVFITVEDGSFVVRDENSYASVNAIKMTDAVTGGLVYLRIKDGQTSVSDS